MQSGHPGRSGEAPVHVGNYRLMTRLGEGGMGIVHLAQGPDGRRVALKLLRPQVAGDDEARGRLAREVNSLQRVRSPWVAEMFDADPWDETPYVVTRYVPGLSLHEHVQAEGPVVGSDLHWLAGCLAEGIAAVHAVGVLHRDVKPGNVLMEGRTPILIDFGLARVADDARITQAGWLLGTPGYLAPEILYGDDATPAADVHAWAATVAYAATGRAPYGRGPSTAIMDRTRRGQHDLSGIEQPLADVLAAALHPDPLERPLLSEILDWLRPLSTRPELPKIPPPGALFAPAVDDDFTLPLALASGVETARPAPPPPPAAVAPPASPPPPPPPAPELAPTLAGPPRTDPMTRMEEEWDRQHGLVETADPWADPAAVAPAPLPERLRRWTAIGLGALGVGAGFAAFPWVTSVVVVLAVWLLRAGSLATSAVADRRSVRGVKWYDALRWITTSPWHLVRAITGTLILVSWSLGLGLAAGLICYAFALDPGTTLLISGTTLSVALWSGPGAGRFRSPISRVLHPACRQPGTWLFVCAGLLAVAAILGVVALAGVNWLPWSSGPFGW